MLLQRYSLVYGQDSRDWNGKVWVPKYVQLIKVIIYVWTSNHFANLKLYNFITINCFCLSLNCRVVPFWFAFPRRKKKHKSDDESQLDLLSCTWTQAVQVQFAQI